ncbi:MAG: hypothetical protein JO314_09590 [Acidobacteria bacterium]|nr:hypothetical protein [Acidobacteriota bacterium]
MIKLRRPHKIALISLASLLVIAGGAFLLYYQSLKKTPQYSLALLIDAARRDDKDQFAQLIDTDAVVDDFVGQVIDKAVDLYGRGVPQVVIDKARDLAQPILPVIKSQAHDRLAAAIKFRTKKFANVPFFVMVFAADRYLQIDENGDIATVHSKIQDQPLDIKMKRNGDRWQVVGVKDDQLATDCAKSIGQELMDLATAKITDAAAQRLGVGNLLNLVRQAENLFDQ